MGSLALKGQALDGRAKPKDSYDIFALTHYNGGTKQAADYFNKIVQSKKLVHANQRLLEHSIKVIKDKFKDASQMGCFQVESFTENNYNRNVVAQEVNQFLNAIT